MSAIIDSFGAIPDRELLGTWMDAFGRFAGYRRMFGARLGALDELPSVEGFVAGMDALGIEAVYMWLHRGSEPGALDRFAAIREDFPGRFVPIVSYDPLIQDRCAALRADHERLGLGAVALLPIVDDRPADDAANDPVFDLCGGLELPVWVHCVNTWSERHAAEFCHPRTVDAVAGRFPDLRIVIGHGGWPWVLDAVTVAWRREHVYLEPSAFRWKHFATTGSGWESLLLYGDSVLAQKVLFGSAWPLVGVDPRQAIEDVRGLGLRDETLRAWLGGNAARLFRR